MSLYQAMFKGLTNNVMTNPDKKVAHREEPLRLREDDLPTAARQAPQARAGLVHKYHQTLARDIICNVGKLGFQE
ncbi:MAG: hypothetical protein ACKPKO_17910, partial [Candidatus Fonsibacter sp.]